VLSQARRLMVTKGKIEKNIREKMSIDFSRVSNVNVEACLL
jgi:hypothetical protein